MIIDCISDLHGYYPELEGGDLLIIAGDLTLSDTHEQYLQFLSWLHKQKYKHYIFVAGNHDGLIEKREVLTTSLDNTTYLFDSATEFEGLKVWGSPWTHLFDGVNPRATAFMLPKEELQPKFSKIPQDVDILITHSPPFGILDVNRGGECCGSIALMQPLYGERIKPKLHVFGHVHESYGKIEWMIDYPYTWFVNCSHINGDYEPVNAPIRMIL